jgi:hypothetical protein
MLRTSFRQGDAADGGLPVEGVCVANFMPPHVYCIETTISAKCFAPLIL